MSKEVASVKERVTSFPLNACWHPRRAVALGLAAAFLATPVVDSQAPADFSGVWRVDPSQTRVSGGPVRLTARGGGASTTPVKIKDVPPRYPREALKARVAGAVVIEALIDREGNVTEMELLRSIPELDQAALDAVAQWKYAPARLDGEAIPVVMTVSVNFSILGVAPVAGIPVAPGNLSSGGHALGRGRGLGPGLGPGTVEVTIAQTAESMVATRETPNGRETLTYRFDGSEVRNRQLGGGSGPPGEYRYVTRWDTQALVSTITGPATNPVSRIERRFLEGTAMVVEVVRSAPAGADPWVTQQVYLRVSRE
jgi:TonB family protein